MTGQVLYDCTNIQKCDVRLRRDLRKKKRRPCRLWGQNLESPGDKNKFSRALSRLRESRGPRQLRKTCYVGQRPERETGVGEEVSTPLVPFPDEVSSIGGGEGRFQVSLD